MSKLRLNRRSASADFQYSNQNLIVSVRDVIGNENGQKLNDLDSIISKAIIDDQDTVSVSVNTKFQIKNKNYLLNYSNKYRLSIIYFKNKRMFQTLSNLNLKLYFYSILIYHLGFINKNRRHQKCWSNYIN